MRHPTRSRQCGGTTCSGEGHAAASPVRTAVNIDRAVFALAGTLTTVSILLAFLVSSWWLLLACFVGINQLQASITGVCPAAAILRRLGVEAGCAFR